MLRRLEGINESGYKRWSKTEWWMESYERLWDPHTDATNHDPPQNDEKLPSTPSTCHKDAVVYLTADSEEELSELKPDETYIIGGIVDRNRYKVHLISFPCSCMATHLPFPSVNRTYANKKRSRPTSEPPDSQLESIWQTSPLARSLLLIKYLRFSPTGLRLEIGKWP